MARRALVAASLLALALSACGGGGSSDDNNGPSRPPALLGVTSGALTNPGAPIASEVKVMADSGVTALRVPFYWTHIEPQRGKFDFSGVDPFVAATARAHIALLPIALRAPGWADRPAGARQLAARRHRELRRLPDGADQALRARWLVLERQPGPAQEPDRVLADLERAEPRPLLVRPALRRRLRPACEGGPCCDQEGGPGRGGRGGGLRRPLVEMISQIYRAGAKGVFDAVAIHPYTYKVSNVLRLVRYARRSLQQAGDGDRPLWLTEVTWSSGKRPGHTPSPFETTEPDQAKRLGEALPLLISQRKALGIDRIFWENWISTDTNHSDPFDFSGLRVLSPNGSIRAKPAYDVFKRIALAQR